MEQPNISLVMSSAWPKNTPKRQTEKDLAFENCSSDIPVECDQGLYISASIARLLSEEPTLLLSADEE
eukprot:scaffold48834_cov59-Cyclotella_meneghiniana.AAC.7